jgi:hypothetical protein
MTHVILSSFAIAAMLALLASGSAPAHANEITMETLKVQAEAAELKGRANAASANAKLRKQQLKPAPKTSKAIKKMPDVFISSFQSGGSSNRGKGAPPPPPPKDDCMSCAD